MKDNLIKLDSTNKGDVTMKQNNVNDEQKLLHSFSPLGEGGHRPDEGLKETVRCNSDEMLKQVQHDGKETAKGGQQSLHSFAPWGEGDRRSDEGLKRRAKDAQSQCPPLETLPNINNPVDCLCERKPEFSIPRRGTKNYDVTRHSATEPKNVKDLTSYRLNVLTSSTKAAFTLAEVLITLAVIGIVAAMTLPGLIQNHNEKAWSTAKDLWEKKLTETVRRMNTDGVMTGHDSTEDFMNSFKQYMKVIKTCDNTDINKCYSPKVVTTGSNEEPLEVETDSLTSASSMGLSDWQTNTNTMSFVVADGTTVIMAYQPECPYADPIEDQGSQVSCMAYMVDVNGKKGPNRVGKDIQLSSGVAFSTCDNPIGDMCWSTEFAATRAINTCEGSEYEDMEQYHGNGSYCSTNYWAGAKLSCQEKGMELPTMAELAQLASELYVKSSDGSAVTIGANEDKYNLKVKEAYQENPPIKYNNYDYWSSEETSAYGADYRTFTTSYTYGDGGWGNKINNIRRAICVSN